MRNSVTHPLMCAATVVTLSLDRYVPSVDLAQLSMREIRNLSEHLASLSDLANALCPNAGPLARYWDHWQALLTEQRMTIERIVGEMQPSDPQDQWERSWLLARMRLDSADGLMVAVGQTTAPDDDFSLALMEVRSEP